MTNIVTTITAFTNELIIKEMRTPDGDPYYWILTEDRTHILTIFTHGKLDENFKYITRTLPTIKFEDYKQDQDEPELELELTNPPNPSNPPNSPNPPEQI